MLFKIKGFNIGLFLVCLVPSLASVADAQDKPEDYRMLADISMINGRERLEEARILLDSNPQDIEDVKSVLYLYAQAGELFQDARRIYEMIGEEYAPPELLKESREAMAFCERMIKQVKKQLGGVEVEGPEDGG